MDKMIPAIPGKVRTDPNPAIIHRVTSTYSSSARSAMIPSAPYAISIISITIPRPMAPATILL